MADWTHVPVAHIMTCPPIMSGPNETVRDLAQKMAKNQVGSVIIKDSKHTGIVTDGDIIEKVLARDLSPLWVPARRIMSKPLRTIREGEDIIEAARKMRSGNVKRLGVMQGTELVGVVSISDIASIAPDMLELLSERTKAVDPDALESLKLFSGDCGVCDRWSEDLREIEDQLICGECLADDKRNEP